MQQNFLQCDYQFELVIPEKKLYQLLFLSSSKVLLIGTKRNYTLMKLHSSNPDTIKTGKLPRLCQNIKRLDDQTIIYTVDNNLIVFKVEQQEIRQKVTIQCSKFYEEQFKAQVILQKIIFYKVSILKSNPISINYEIHLYEASKSSLTKIKKIKKEYQNLRKVTHACDELVSYQISGYTIEVDFLQSNKIQKINSIYSLFLKEIKPTPTHLFLMFTHQQLEEEVCVFGVCQQKITKRERQEIQEEIGGGVTCSQDGSKNILWSGWNCGGNGKVIVKGDILKSSRYLFLIDNLQTQISNHFSEMILSLL